MIASGTLRYYLEIKTEKLDSSVFHVPSVSIILTTVFDCASVVNACVFRIFFAFSITKTIAPNTLNAALPIAYFQTISAENGEGQPATLLLSDCCSVDCSNRSHISLFPAQSLHSPPTFRLRIGRFLSTVIWRR